MPLSAARTVRDQRLLTPAEHLGVLVVPPVASLRDSLKRWTKGTFEGVRILDTTLGLLRAELREQLELNTPVVVTGHQPEFIHAGVFAKSVAAHALAEQLGGQAVYVTVDSDVPKRAQITIPQSTAAGLRRVEIAIPATDRRLPYELQPRLPRADWLQFFANIGAIYELRDEALLGTWARAWLTTTEASPAYCDAYERARAACEAALGLDGIRELRISRLCASRAFRCFVAHCLLNAPRVVVDYNAAQAAYRQRHRIRAPGRPVPRLIVDGDTLELPFWVLGPEEPRRRLFITLQDDTIELSTDNRRIGIVERRDLGKAAAHADPWPLEAEGWQLRPRALMLSAFARLFLADVFIHGIGGAQYDEMMEDFVRSSLGIEPAPLGCVSATLHLPLRREGVRRADIAAARQRRRDLRYNPHRHLRNVPEQLLRRREELIRRSDELRADQPGDHVQRSVTFREMRRVNEQILKTDPWRMAEYDQRVRALETQWSLDRIALDREYFFALHAAGTLEELTQRVRAKLR